MNSNLTLKAFTNSISEKICENLRNNLISKNEKEISLNTVELNFDFKNKKVTIYYFITDKNYPTIKMDFLKFRTLLKSKKEIITPFTQNSVITEINTSKFYSFKCLNCKNIVKLSYNNQLKHLNEKAENLKDGEFQKLKKYYNIGLTNKSNDELPVFDKIYCNSCGTNYYTYVGISEPRNSVYHITIQGILRK